MKMITYWQSLSPGDKAAMANRLATSRAYLSQIANGHRNPSHRFAKKIENDTGETVTIYELRPDIYSGLEKPATEAA